MIAYLFGIHVVTLAKAIWIALTFLNVAMMLALMWKNGASSAGVYFFFMAIIALVQGSPLWALPYEGILAGASMGWVWSMLPRDKYGRVFALSVGLCVTCVLIAAVPPPWKGYPADMYYTRLFSTAAFFGITLGIAVLDYFVRWEGKRLRVFIPPIWFASVLMAGSQRGWNYWAVAITCNAIWSSCLIAWLLCSRGESRREGNTAHQGLYSISGR